jgi:hypothetical protein
MDFKSDKKCRMTSFTREVKLSAPYHKFLWHVKNPYRYEKRYLLAKFTNISPQVSSPSLLGVSAATRAENSSGWIRNY